MRTAILANVLRASHKSTHLLGNSSSGADKVIPKVNHVHSMDKQVLKEAKDNK